MLITPRRMVPCAPLLFGLGFVVAAVLMLAYSGWSLNWFSSHGNAFVIFGLVCVGAVTCAGVWGFRQLQQLDAIERRAGIEINLEQGWVRSRIDAQRFPIAIPVSIGLRDTKTISGTHQGTMEWLFTLEIKGADGRSVPLLQERWPGFCMKSICAQARQLGTGRFSASKAGGVKCSGRE